MVARALCRVIHCRKCTAMKIEREARPARKHSPDSACSKGGIRQRPWLLWATVGLSLWTSLGGALPDGYETIYLTPAAPPEVRQAAEMLAERLEATFGERPRIRRLPLIGGKGIRIGPEPESPNFDRDSLTDEISLRRDARGLALTGSDTSSTFVAVARFIESALGWHYFAPGALGMERLDTPPAPPPLKGPHEQLLLEKADWISRNPWPLNGPGGGPDWRAWHGLRERFQYNHTLHRTVVPADFKEHPDWFAKDVDGQPMRPPFAHPHAYNDHPDLTSDGVRARVLERTTLALETAWQGRLLGSGTPTTYPPVTITSGSASVSVSLGDSFVFGNYPSEYPWNPAGYDRRWPDWSNHVFSYSNFLAEELTRFWEQSTGRPPLYIGALSYLVWENVPDFAVHPAIVPYLTFDRSQWYDPQARQDDLARVEAWDGAGTKLTGTWDYLFSDGFIIPRSLTGIVATSIPALHERGVDAYFSQVGAVWPFDAQVNWLTARLLWDSGVDPDRLLDLFYAEYFGPAAEPMRKFFEEAEAIWMATEGRGWWLRYWRDPFQAALWSPAQLMAAETLLDKAARAAEAAEAADSESLQDPERFVRRVAATSQVFALTRLFLEYQWLQWRLQEALDGPASAEILRLAADNAERCLQLRKQMKAKSTEVGLAATGAGPIRDLSWVFRYDTVGAAVAALLIEADRLGWRADDPARQQLNKAMEQWIREQGLQGMPVTTKPVEMLFDRDLRHSNDRRIWHHQFMDAEGASISNMDGAGFAVESIRRGHIYQLFRAEPGVFYLGQAGVTTEQSPSGEVHIRIDFFDTGHQLIRESPRARIHPAIGWQRQLLHCLGQAPPEAAYGRLMIRFFEMDPGSRAAVDSVSVRRLDLNP